MVGYFYIWIFVCVCVLTHAHMYTEVKRGCLGLQEILSVLSAMLRHKYRFTCGQAWLFTWVLGYELRSSRYAARIFTTCTMFLAI